MRGCFFTIIFSSLFLVACEYHVIKGAGNASDPISFGENTTVDANFVQKSVMGTCLRCHSGNTSPNLSSIDNLRINIEKVKTQIFSGKMPPADSGYQSLSDCQKQILQQWSNEGMPNTSNTLVVNLESCKLGTPSQPPEKNILDMPINYSTLVTKILQPRCLHCHNAKSSDPDASEILLYPYSDLIAHKKFFASHAEDSKFYHLVARTDEDRMPPPEDGPALSQDEIEFVKRWIDQGLVN